MPITYTIDTDNNLAIVKASGRLSDEAILKFEQEMIDDPRRRPGILVLFDARNVNTTTISREAIRKILELERKHFPPNGKSRTAIVINDQDGWQRACEFADKAGRKINVFSNIDVARAWLGYTDVARDL